MGIERGDDAKDHAPRSDAGGDPKTKPPENAKQDAENYEKRDGAEAVPLEDMSSANDEGAN